MNLQYLFAEIKQSSKIAFPLMISEATIALSGLFVNIILASLDTKFLAAHALLWNAYLTLTLFFIGIFLSTSILVSHKLGIKDYYSVTKYLHQGIILAVILSPIIMVIMWFYPSALTLTKQNPIIVEIVRSSSRSLIWSILPLGVMVVIQNFFIALHRAYLVTVMNVLSLIMQSTFFYLFILGKLGFPKLGLVGLGYSLSLSFILIDIIFLFYLFRSRKFHIIPINAPWKINFKILWKFLRVGLPIGMSLLIELMLFAVIVIMIGKLGTIALAAYQITYQYLILALIISFALIYTTTVRVSTETSINGISTLKVIVLGNTIIGLLLTVMFSIVYVFFPEIAIKIMELYSNNKKALSPNLIAQASQFLSVIGIFIIFDCIRLIITGALRGLKDTKTTMVIDCISLWFVALPCSYLLGFKFAGAGILWGMVIGILFSILALTLRLKIYLKNKMSEQSPGLPH